MTQFPFLYDARNRILELKYYSKSVYFLIKEKKINNQSKHNVYSLPYGRLHVSD